VGGRGEGRPVRHKMPLGILIFLVCVCLDWFGSPCLIFRATGIKTIV